MKILQVGSALYDWGGIERYVKYLHDGLEDRGHEVHVTAPPYSPLAERTEVIPIALRKRFDPLAFAAYLRLFRRERYDVVHGHFSPDFALVGLAAKLCRQPFTVLTRHVALPWSRAKVRRYLRFWNGIIPVSQAVRTKLAESGVPETRMCVAKAGVPLANCTMDRATVREELALRPGFFAAGSFSRLAKEKGIDVFLRAIPWAPQTHAYVYGDGPAGEELARLSSFLRVAQQVSFIGRVTDVANHMQAMDVVVIPSLWEEAFPYAALEALSLGVPVVASRVGGIPEIIEEGVNGFLFTKGSPEDLARVLQTASADPDNLRRMGEAGRDLARQEYTINRMAERIEAAYLTLRDARG